MNEFMNEWRLDMLRVPVTLLSYHVIPHASFSTRVSFILKQYASLRRHNTKDRCISLSKSLVNTGQKVPTLLISLLHFKSQMVKEGPKGGLGV